MNLKLKKSYWVMTVFAILLSCAHELKPTQLSNDANPTTEISNQEALVTEAVTAQTDVFAPKKFEKAEKYLKKAKKQNQNEASNTKVLETLGHSKSYFSAASEEALANKTLMPEIVRCREAAIKAGAKSYPDQLNSIDDKLKKITADIDEKNHPIAADISDLEKQYLDLELSSLKHTYLDQAQALLKQTKNDGAEKITPVAYKQAVQKYNSTEKLIETDRHSDYQIKKSADDTTASAQRVVALLDSAQNSKRQTPEQRAVGIEEKDIALKNAAIAGSIADTEARKKDREINVQGAALSDSEDENREYRQKELDDKIVNDAAAQFQKSEADVYRQDGNLVIRLKSMNFAPGRSDLPSASLGILSKVKDVIKNLEPDSVLVEGHTDAIGGAASNQALSKNRAQSVANYFVSDRQLGNSKVEFSGIGFNKPLASNKTKLGRAQNRRVDIIIKNVQAY